MSFVAIDFETALIQPGLQAPPPVCLGVTSKSIAKIFSYNEILDQMLTVLQNPIVGCNIAFDLMVACEAFPQLWPIVMDQYDKNRITDISIRQKLIDIALGDYDYRRKLKGSYSLAGLAKRLCNKVLEKEDTWRLRYWELIDIPLDQWPSEAIEYSRKDANTTLEIFEVQEEELSKAGRLYILNDQFRQCRAAFALKLASAWGLRTDPRMTHKLKHDCEQQIRRLQQELLDVGLLRNEKGKIKKCMREAQRRIFERDPKARLTKKGLELRDGGHPRSTYRQVKYISADAEACEDSLDPMMSKYTQYNQLSNILSKDIPVFEQGFDQPIHTYFEILMNTGRTSSSEPALQNLRRAPGVRECFKARPGYVYAGCDIDKAELCTLAQCCYDLFDYSILGDALNGGYDPHIGLGARLAKTTYDDLAQKISDGDETAKEWRQRAKAGNFGFPGGMGPAGMQRYAKKTYNVIMPLEESIILKEGWEEQWPDVAVDYLNWVRQHFGTEEYAYIKHFMSNRWRGRVTYCAAANSFFQGRAADAKKAALWEITKKCYLPGTALFGCRVVNDIHDEIIAEVPICKASDAAFEMRDTMVRAYRIFTPDVEIRSTPVLMDHWSKKAKSIIENGELKVWHYDRRD